MITPIITCSPKKNLNISKTHNTNSFTLVSLLANNHRKTNVQFHHGMCTLTRPYLIVKHRAHTYTFHSPPPFLNSSPKCHLLAPIPVGTVTLLFLPCKCAALCLFCVALSFSVSARWPTFQIQPTKQTQRRVEHHTVVLSSLLQQLMANYTTQSTPFLPFSLQKYLFPKWPTHENQSQKAVRLRS